MIIIYKKCPICGEIFKVNSKKRGRPKIYCSKLCRKKEELIKRKECRLFEKKCKYCGKLFIGNKKNVYCSDDCAKSSEQDYRREHMYDLYHSDYEYKQRKLENIFGTFIIPKNLDEEENRDWEKEYKTISYLKKKAGLK